MNGEDIVVIGSGPAGFTAAVRASQLGAKVALVERGNLGGICTNWGCHPVLFLTRCVSVSQLMKKAAEYGIGVGKVNIDFTRMIAGKNEIIKAVRTRMLDAIEANKIELVNGWGRLISPKRVEVELDDGSRRVIQAKKVVIASGSFARRYSIPGATDAGVITPKELFELNEIPKSIIIIGRSVTALELASIWVNLGSVVSVVGRGPLLPGEDDELASYIEHVLREEGVQIYTGVDIDSIAGVEGAKLVNFSTGEARHKLKAQLVVFAIGQSPIVKDLGLESIGVTVSQGSIQTNTRMETSVEGVYAAGDTTGEIMLANVAMAQGAVAAENAMGGNSVMDYRVVPRFIRTLPEMAAVGISERDARERKLDVRVGKSPLVANTKALVLKEVGGFVKIVADSTSGEVLGVQIIGPQATELIGEAVMIMQLRGTVQDVACATHAHPSVHEAIMKAAQDLYYQAYYTPSRKTS